MSTLWRRGLGNIQRCRPDARTLIGGGLIMGDRFHRRTLPGPRPCQSSEVLTQMLADERSAHMLVTPAESEELATRTTLTPKGWLAFHAVTFLIVFWNLFAINLMRTPGQWWFWMPGAALAGALLLHAVWVLLRGRRAAAAEAHAALTREASAP